MPNKVMNGGINMKQVAYTNHIGHSSRDTHSGKSTAISTLTDLAATEKHNNHDYHQSEVDRMQSSINLDLREHNHQYVMRDGQLAEIEGHLDLEEEVQRIYQEQFSAAVDAYNQRQIAKGHPERQISSYIDKISESSQQEIAVEGLIQYGSLEDWEGMSMEDRERAVPLLLRGFELTVGQLRQDGAEFIPAGISIHLNEGTPHLHYVGVPVAHCPDARNGMTSKVKKSAVFTKESLGTGLQDNVRAMIEPEMTAAFGWTFEAKEAGRNKDLSKNQIASRKLQEQCKKLQEEAQEAQERLDAINQSIDDAQWKLRAGMQKFGANSIAEVVSNPEGIYTNILFLAAECGDDRFDELDREGRELREQFLQETFDKSIDPILQGLDQSIAAINSKKPPKITWEQRQQMWEQYGQISNEFWPMRAELQEQYRTDLNVAYQKKRDAMKAYYDSLYLIRRSRSIIFVLLVSIRTLTAINRMKEYQRQIDELRHKRDLLVKNTTDFSKFSRQYRENLKAGRFPGSDMLDSMTGIIRDLDEEHLQFQIQNKGHKRSHDPQVR